MMELGAVFVGGFAGVLAAIWLIRLTDRLLAPVYRWLERQRDRARTK